MIKAINKMIKNKKGFTLVELIVVLAVLGIIAAIAVPRFTGIQENSKWKADIATANNIAKAAELYYANVGTAPSLADLTPDYLDVDPVPQYNGSSATAFVLSMTGGQATVKYDTPSGTPTVLYPNPPSTKP